MKNGEIKTHILPVCSCLIRLCSLTGHYPGPPPLITLTWSPHLCNSSLRLKLHQLHWIKTFQQGIMCKQTSSRPIIGNVITKFIFTNISIGVNINDGSNFSHINKTSTYEDPRKWGATEPEEVPEPRDVTLERHPELGFGFVAGSEKPVIVR